MLSDYANTLTLIKLIREKLAAKKQTCHIEVRHYHRPVYYQLWIKDPHHAKGIAHYNIVQTEWFKPNIRVTAKTSKRLFEYLSTEFDKYWDDPNNTPEN